MIIEGTAESELTADTMWREYGFKASSTSPRRRPRQVTPYHLRRDWMLWFVSFSPRYGATWLPKLAEKLLAAGKATLKLLRHDPFEGSPPKFLRARLFRYRHTTWRERKETGAWWSASPEVRY